MTSPLHQKKLLFVALSSPFVGFHARSQVPAEFRMNAGRVMHQGEQGLLECVETFSEFLHGATSFVGYGASFAHAKRNRTHEMRIRFARGCVKKVTGVA